MEAQEKKQEQETDGCTFAPDMVTERSSEVRTLDQFLNDQSRFLEAKSKKTEDFKNQMSVNEVSVMHPQIDETSRRIVEMNPERQGKAVHTRLYDLDKELKEK
jgi:hypothetical protein